MVSKTYITVRYVETDQMGIVHHSNYPIWFEVARMEYIKKLGIPNTIIESKGFLLPVTELSCSFKSPAKCGEEILVTAKISQFSCVRLEFEYQIFNNSTDIILVKGITKHAWTDKNLTPVNIKKGFPELYDLISKNS